MSKCSTVVIRAGAAAFAGSLLIPDAGFAHGLAGGYDPGRAVIDYVWLGFWHMLAGWDHLLFIAGVLLLAGNVRTAAKLISLFVLGHSITLLTATLAGWRLDPALVDAVIALSLVWVGVQGIRGRPADLRVAGAIVLAFGLVHGLGLSTRLQDLGLPDSGVAVRVILFNVGVEIGQLVALTIMVGVGTLLARRLSRRGEVTRYAFTALAVAGLIAAAAISFQGGEDQAAQVAQRGTCIERTSAMPPFMGGDHPAKSFYGPGETAPVEDLTHVLGDGLVIVRYRPDLARQHVAALERFTRSGRQRYVIAAPDPDLRQPLRALTAERALSCRTVDTTALGRFRDEWLASLRQ